MKRLLKWLGGIVGAIVLAIVVFFFSMRFHDGPIEIISGGPFRTGEQAQPPGDWSYLKDRPTIQFQTMDPATSRTVWLAVHEQKLYLASAYMTTGYGRIWKQWPHYLENDDRVILRIDGKLYHVRLARQMDGDFVQPVLDEFGRKYGLSGSPEVVRRGEVWLYEVVPE